VNATVGTSAGRAAGRVTGTAAGVEAGVAVGVAAGLTELAAEFPGYEFSTQQTWQGVSFIAVRQDGSARPGLYAVITADLDEMRHALRESESPSALSR
jgi:hypothetical protein